MKEKQVKQFNYMLIVLTRIAKQYSTLKQLRKDSEDEYWLEYEEALEMAYENIKLEAKECIKWVKTINP